jgi:Leucine Rich repeats (2 copies)/Leucine rich repeat
VLLGMVVIVLAVGAVIGSVCGTGGCFSSSPTAVSVGSPPTKVVSPTVSPRAEQVTSFINNITLTGRTIAVSAESNDTSLDLEALALRWLIDYDKGLPNTPTNRFHLQQRYALATLQVQQEGAVLGIDDNECTWSGVTCQNVSLGTELGIQEAVTEVYIDTYNNGNLWIGRLSADLGLLSTLIHFKMNGDANDVMTGGLVGTLPSQIGLLTNLQTLDFALNRLTGSLPTQIGQLTNLSSLVVAQNNLRSLPSQIGQLTTLQSLDLSYNELSGYLISQIGQLTNLQDLDLFYNDMSGSLPSQIGQMTSLIFLSVSDNALSGSLPSQIGKLTNLQYLYLSGNKFIGTVPDSVCLLRNQSLFDLWADCVSEVSCNCCNDCY